MNGLYSRTIPEALTGGLTGGEQDQSRLILVEPDGKDQALTAPELRALIGSAARQARSAGIQPGEPVLLVFEHGLAMIRCFLGLVMAGAVPCLLPYWSDSTATRTVAEIHRLAVMLGARWVVTSTELSSTLDELLAKESLHLLALQGREPEFPDEAMDIPKPDAEATAYLQLTSGATDAPKLIAVSHRALINHVRALHSHLALEATDTFVGWLPLHHDMGLIIQLWLPLITGVRSVLIAPDYWVRRPRVLFQAVSRYAGTITFMPNFAFSHCTRYVGDKDLRALDLTRWRRVINGAEPVRADTMRAFAALLETCGVQPTALGAGYGLGENVGGVTITLPGQPPLVDWVSPRALQESNQAVPAAPAHGQALAVVSCGYPIPGTEVVILDERRQVLPDRCLGEIAVRGDSLCTAYVGAGPIPDDAGWCLTGDVGYLCDGQLYVCDRKKDLIITGGRNIHPQWIEALATDVLGSTAGQVAAFAVPNPLLGTELSVLVCEVRGKFDAVQQAGWAAEIRRRVQNELRITLADIQVVRRGWVIQTTSGKVARRATRDKYLAAGYRPELPGLALLHAAGNDRALLTQGLTELFADMLGVATVQVDDSFFDLGGDSLTALRFILAVEEATGQRVPTEFFREPTVAHLVQLLVGDESPVTADISSAPQAAPARPAAKKQSRSWTQRIHSLPQRARLRMRAAVEAQAFRKPYFEGVQWLLAWCGRPWVQALFYPQERQLVCRFAESMGTPAAQVAQEVTLSLAGAALFHRWLTSARRRARPDQPKPALFADLDDALRSAPGSNLWDQYLSIEGTVHIDEAIAAGRGGILVGFHSPTRYATPHYFAQLHVPLARVGRSQYGEIAQRLYLLSDGNDDRHKWWTPARAAVATEAYRSLMQGGLVGIAGDELTVANGVPAVIGERIYRLSSGFAVLAATTGAAVLPFYSALLPDGHTQITIAPPLEWDRSSHRGQVEDIVQAYARVQTAIWQQMPSVVSKEIMEQHLALSCAGYENDV